MPRQGSLGRDSEVRTLSTNKKMNITLCSFGLCRPTLVANWTTPRYAGYHFEVLVFCSLQPPPSPTIPYPSSSSHGSSSVPFFCWQWNRKSFHVDRISFHFYSVYFKNGQIPSGNFWQAFGAHFLPLVARPSTKPVAYTYFTATVVVESTGIILLIWLWNTRYVFFFCLFSFFLSFFYFFILYFMYQQMGGTSVEEGTKNLEVCSAVWERLFCQILTKLRGY